MSKAAYWQRGEALDYVNAGTEKIEANTVIVLGSRIGVAGMEISPGETGTLHVTGVYSIPKGSTEIPAGSDVYYSEADGEITTAATVTIPAKEGESESSTVKNVKAGFACEGASASDTTVLVKINA